MLKVIGISLGIVLCLLANIIYAEPIKIDRPHTAVVNTVILVVCESDINKMLVVNNNGDWVSDAREIVYTSTIGSSAKPTVRCTMYKGLFKPTNPEIKEWEVTSIILANTSEFQKILDDLSKNKFLVNNETNDKEPVADNTGE